MFTLCSPWLQFLWTYSWPRYQKSFRLYFQGKLTSLNFWLISICRTSRVHDSNAKFIVAYVHGHNYSQDTGKSPERISNTIGHFFRKICLWDLETTLLGDCNAIQNVPEWTLLTRTNFHKQCTRRIEVGICSHFFGKKSIWSESLKTVNLLKRPNFSYKVEKLQCWKSWDP